MILALPNSFYKWLKLKELLDSPKDNTGVFCLLLH